MEGCQAGGPIGPRPTFFWYVIVEDFLEGRGVVKGERKEMVGEGVLMCVDVVTSVVCCVAIVRRSVSTRITFRGCFLLKVAETRGFYGAEFFSAFGSSPEPVVFSRATHNRDDLDVHDGVKRIFFR
ncbi:hypothetical protein Pan241w_36760 [Gimesia alba]|uniref:Uncharacterized protein n=2 Tax=Gimesia alba TaxID=2527973 RepID=A0A517RI59_9PLAN|nr:hypothetical protein Pan241w_36760 [Gimesia alba]